MPVRPGDHQRRDEMRPALLRRGRAAFCKLCLHTGQRRGEILARPGPVGREQAGRAVQRVDADAGIIRQRRQSGGIRRRDRLDRSVLGEHVAVFHRLGQAELAGRDQLDPIGRHQLAHFAQLALVVGRDHNLAGEEARFGHRFGFNDVTVSRMKKRNRARSVAGCHRRRPNGRREEQGGIVYVPVWFPPGRRR